MDKDTILVVTGDAVSTRGGGVKPLKVDELSVNVNLFIEQMGGLLDGKRYISHPWYGRRGGSDGRAEICVSSLPWYSLERVVVERKGWFMIKLQDCRRSPHSIEYTTVDCGIET